MLVTLDFETASPCDLKVAGAWRYSEDPNTEILSLVWLLEGPEDAPVLWIPGNTDSLLYNLAANSEVEFQCHASFEQAIWANIMVPVFGFAPIPIARWVDTQASCALHAIPLDLDHALSVMGVPVTKDLEGRKVTLSLSKVDKKTGMLPERTPELMEKVYAYNRIDVEGTRLLGRALGVLPEDERRIWEIDQAINQRGIGIDLQFVRAARDIVRRESLPLLLEFKDLTGLKPTQGAKFIAWLADQGVEIPNMQKATVAKLLGEDDEDDEDCDGAEWDSEAGPLPDHVRRALVIRTLTSSASVKKLARMEECVCEDGRARGLTQYHVASTGRWAGRILQPQNFPRGTVKGDPEDLVRAILGGSASAIRDQYGEPVEVVMSSLRHALVAHPGHIFVAADYAGIEARIVLALAGQTDKTALMASGADVYSSMASDIYKRPVTKETDPEARQIGKNTVLGCGFQMGWKTFRDRYLKHMPPGIETDEFAKRVVDAYRKVWAPRVPRLWADLEEAALHAAMNPGLTSAAKCGIMYKVKDIGGKPFMVCRLLDGKCLYYFDPRVGMKAMPWSTEEKPDVRRCWKYRAKRKGQWRWIYAYGGILTENVVQALARQLLCRALERFDTLGMPVVLTVHDEVVLELDDHTDWGDIVSSIMCEPVAWATDIGVPIEVEVWQNRRFKK
jgi:DNA polymerase